MIKVRFAPSPTGYLHIGGARTALFNWMYAKSQGGQFVLRIEDTDVQRSKKEFEEEILSSMKWLGLDWDELYYQSQRFELYREYADKLLEEGKAYKDGDAIILSMPEKEVKLYDLIRGEITFDSTTLKDQVLFKSDGSPTYSFACVLDDHLMGISHVVRGEDHISNTPKQIVIYEALGFKTPKYAHLPLIMGEDGGRLSKRTGAVAVTDYRKEGFLSKALVNYLMLLGWAPGNNQEKIELEQAVKKFSIKKVNKAAAIFSMDKLRWLNGQYIKDMKSSDLLPSIESLLEDQKMISANTDQKWLQAIIDLYKGRLAVLTDFMDWADFFFKDSVDILDEDREKHLLPEKTALFPDLQKKFQDLDSFDGPSVEAAFKSVIAEHNMKPGDMIHPLRVVMTGKTIGPSLFEIIALLGKDTVLTRLTAS